MTLAAYIMGSGEWVVDPGAASLQAASAAQAASATAPNERLPTYFPNTEELRPDEMRITALGTGLPTPLTRAQKSTAWMVELGKAVVPCRLSWLTVISCQDCPLIP
jgi:ribonuclease Z